MKADTERQDFFRLRFFREKKWGFFLFGGFFWLIFFFSFEGKIDIVWEERAAELYEGSSNFFPMK